MDKGRMLRVRYFLLSFCATFFLVSLLFLFLMTTVHPTSPQLPESDAAAEEEAYLPDGEDALTVLFFGTDGADAVAGTYILARFDPVLGGVSVAVLPPQTAIESGGQVETLSEAYRYGGAKYTRQLLADYLNIPIDRYVRMSLSGFVEAAAAIGSVEFDLERELVLADGELSLTLNPGRQLLDGRRAAALIRHRDWPGGEPERCRVTARLTCAIIDQRIDVASSVLADKIFETVINLVDTDISYADYEERRAPAQMMAELAKEGPIAVAVEVSGSLSEDGRRLTLRDTTLAALAARFA